MTIESIENHMAKTCECGSVNFALLESGGIECNKCGTALDAKWWTGGLGAQIARAIKAEGERDALQAELDAFKAAPQAPAPTVQHMVNRFLSWKLPRYFAPDGGITFHLTNHEGFDLPQCWPIGTNLLTADQALEMFEYCLQGAAPQAPAPERNFCERCGKRLVEGHIHTCTPPTGEAQG